MENMVSEVAIRIFILSATVLYSYCFTSLWRTEYIKICAMKVFSATCQVMNQIEPVGPKTDGYTYFDVFISWLPWIVPMMFSMWSLAARCIFLTLYVSKEVSSALLREARENKIRLTVLTIPNLLAKLTAKYYADSMVCTMVNLVFSSLFSGKGPTEISKNDRRTGKRSSHSSSSKKRSNRKKKQNYSERKLIVERAHLAALSVITAADVLKEAEDECIIASGGTTPRLELGSGRFAELNSFSPRTSYSTFSYVDNEQREKFMNEVGVELKKLEDNDLKDYNGISTSGSETSAPMTPRRLRGLQAKGSNAPFAAPAPAFDPGEAPALSPSSNRSPRLTINASPTHFLQDSVNDSKSGCSTPSGRPTLTALKTGPSGVLTPVTIPSSPRVVAAEANYRRKIQEAAEALEESLIQIDAEIEDEDGDNDDDFDDDDSYENRQLQSYSTLELWNIRKNSPLIPVDLDCSFEHFVLHSTIISLNEEVTSDGPMPVKGTWVEFKKQHRRQDLGAHGHSRRKQNPPETKSFNKLDARYARTNSNHKGSDRWERTPFQFDEDDYDHERAFTIRNSSRKSSHNEDEIIHASTDGVKGRKGDEAKGVPVKKKLFLSNNGNELYLNGDSHYYQNDEYERGRNMPKPSENVCDFPEEKRNGRISISTSRKQSLVEDSPAEDSPRRRLGFSLFGIRKKVDGASTPRANEPPTFGPSGRVKRRGFASTWEDKKLMKK